MTMKVGSVALKSPQRRLRRLGINFIWFLASLALIGTLLYFVFRVNLTVTADDALREGRLLLSKQTVLAVVAHPDDLEWYIGGTLRRLADAGADVQVIVASLGEKGPNRTGVPNLPEARRQEQLDAADINGYRRVHFLELPDRGVAADPRFLPRVTEIFRQVRPDAVLVFDPQFPSLPYLHTDHQGSARVFLGFWRTLGEDRPPVYLFQTRRPNVAVDISPVVDIKARALAQHRTQNGSGGSGRMSQVFKEQGTLVGVASAETFRVMR
ncbi:PIG-L deacetylase family protein [Deinococcus peraridilitoris]|nr:PIG-L deacetylase family protein [Deinococcus peraridilitoris]